MQNVHLHHKTSFIVVIDETNGFGIKSLVLFIYGQTFCGRTWTLNVSKTLIMNAKLKFDQFSLVISNNKNPFVHEHDSTNQQMSKTMKPKNKRIRFQSIFDLNKKADLWNTVRNIRARIWRALLHPVTYAIFGISFTWKHKTSILSYTTPETSVTQFSKCFYISSRLSGTFQRYECCIFGQDWCCRRIWS